MIDIEGEVKLVSWWEVKLVSWWEMNIAGSKGFELICSGSGQCLQFYIMGNQCVCVFYLSGLVSVWVQGCFQLLYVL